MPQVSLRKVFRNDYASLLYAAFCFLFLFYTFGDLFRAAGFLPPLRKRGSQELAEPSMEFSLVCAVIALMLFVALYVRISRLRAIITHGHHVRAKVTAIKCFKGGMQIKLDFLDESHHRSAAIAVSRTKDSRDIKTGDVLELAISARDPQHVLIVRQFAVP